MRNWTVVIHTKKARRVYERAQKKDRALLDRALNSLEADVSGGDIRRVHGKVGWHRLRAGDWRIQFSVDKSDGVVVVWEIGRKEDDTYK